MFEGILMSLLSIILNIFFILGWLFVISIGNTFKSKQRETTGNLLNTLGILWFFAVILYIGYLFVTNFFIYPWILPPTIFVVFIIIITFFISRFIFSPQMSFQLKELSRYRSYAVSLVFFAPILLALFLYWSKMNVEVETARLLYSSLFLAFSSLLVLVVMFSIFIIDRHVHHRIVNLLIQTVKGVSIIYGLTILLSLLAMIILQSNEITFNYSLFTITSSVNSSIFLGTLSIAVNSIFLTIIIFFQIVDVLKEMNPPSEDKDNVVFDETRLFHSECSISNRKKDGYSELNDSLEDNNFSVSKFRNKPLNYETLKAYDVLVIARIDGDYSNNEIDVIENFVKEGGGLLLTSGFYDHDSKNLIAKRFGVEFGPGQVNQKEKNLNGVTHFPEISQLQSEDEIFKTITKFHLINGTFISKKGNSQVLASSDNKGWLFIPNEEPDKSGNFPILSKMLYEKGRIMFLSSNYQFANEMIGKLNNKQLGLNVIKWLASEKQDKQTKLKIE